MRPLPPPRAGGALGVDLQAAREAALRQRPDLKKANLNVAFAEYNVRLKQAEYLPDVSLVYKYTRPVTSDILPQNISFVGLQLSWDVFNRSRKGHDRRQRERALEQAKTAVDDTASQVLLDVNSSFRKLQDAEAYLKVAALARCRTGVAARGCQPVPPAGAAAQGPAQRPDLARTGE